MGRPAAFRPPPEFTTRPTLTGTFGMVASTHWIASATGQAVLERGGTAADAAVAAAFVLHVVEPHLNGPGGDLTAIVRPAGGPPRVLAGQGPAPAGASVATYRALGLSAVPGSGALAAAVPGAVDAWMLLLRDHGTWEVADVLDFAIGYARSGHPVLERVCATLAAVAPLFREHWPSSAAAWLAEGVPRPGALLRMPAWADTLQRLVSAARGGTREARIDAVRRAWSTGFVAEAVESAVRRPHRHSTGGDHRGVLTADDLARWSATWEDPVAVELGSRWGGWTVHKAGAWTQGPALLVALRLLHDLPDDSLDPATADGVHHLVEAQKLALADRDAWFADDPDVPIPALLGAGYAADRGRLIGAAASTEFQPGRPDGRTPWRPPLAVAGGSAVPGGDGSAGEPTVRPDGAARGDTCHLDVVDRWGTVISATPSGGWLQSSPHIPELGFCLGTRLQMTWLDESSPSALRPGRRPRSTLTPTLLTRPDGAVVALGSPGGDQQDQWQLPYLVRTLRGGFTPQQAIDAPTFHTTALVGSFWPREFDPAGLTIENRYPTDVLDDLSRRGHRVSVAGDWALGRLSMVGRDADGLLSAAANPRGMQGYAVGR